MHRNSLWLGVWIAAILVATIAIFGLPLGESLSRLFQGSFGTALGFERVLVKATPLLLCGLGVMVAWKAGMYNIGGEGQYVIGGTLAAALTLASPTLPAGLFILASCLGGAGLAAFAGWLQVRRGVPAVISTILLNFIALQILSFGVQGPLQDPTSGLPQSRKLGGNALLWHPNPRSDLHLGIVIAAVVAILIWLFIKRSWSGFQLKVVGAAPLVARANGIPVQKMQLVGMAVSGSLFGLAAGIELTALSGRVDAGFSQQWGFLGIPVALLGGLEPVGIAISSLFFGALFAGSQNLARFGSGGDTLIYIVQAVIVLAVVALKQRTVGATDEPA